MSKRSQDSKNSTGWQKNMINLVWDDRDREYVIEWCNAHKDDGFAAVMEQYAFEGHGIKVRWSDYYGAFMLAITFGERIRSHKGKTVITYHTDFGRLAGLIQYIFDVLVENDDPRLYGKRDGEVSW